MNKKVIIAMSGGVDSSVAAYILKNEGFECMGATMKLFGEGSTCCSLEDVEDAKSVAYSLGMEHYVFNFSDEFRKRVIDKFVSSYENGQTPNPCIDCNRYLKFERLLLRAEELGYDYIATGHYAVIEYDDDKGRYLLKKSADPLKDQSYVLYSMTQKQLKHTLFPLGRLSKPQVREIAEREGFTNAKKRDSQDICFVPDGRYADFIERYTGKEYPCGSFIDDDGNVIGEHKGIIRYTVGQRKGLGAFGEPMYVSGVNPITNTVFLTRGKSLYADTVTARNINLISVDSIEKPMTVTAKTRYSGREAPAEAVQTAEDEITVKFAEPQRAPTRGQSLVLYDGDTVVGGGIIQ